MTNTKHLAASLAPFHAANTMNVTFDVNNDEHLRAVEMLLVDGKQHPTLRFRLEYPYLNIRTMMTDKVCRAHLAKRLNYAETHPLTTNSPR